MQIFNWLKDYFDLNRREQRAMTVVLGVIIIIFAASQFIPEMLQKEQQDFSDIEAKAALFSSKLKEQQTEEGEYTINLVEMETEVKHELTPFKFDPNTLSKEGFQKLGLPERVAKNIVNYRSMGGRFWKPQDFSKIYNLREEDYLTLRPYIVIESRQRQSRGYEKATNEPREVKKVIVELNSADSIALLQIRGIGPVFASRIIKFRDLLGGFHSKEQLREVYGLDSSKYEFIAPQLAVDAENVKKVKINSADLNELKRHPYLSYKQASAIINYRIQHGDFNSVEDLRKVYVIDEETVERISLYLSFSPHTPSP